MQEATENSHKPVLEQLASQTSQEMEDQFRTVFESSHDAIFLLTEEGFFDCNPRALEIFSIPARDVMTHIHPADISPPRQPDGRPSMEAALEHIRHAFMSGVDSFEWTHRRMNGEDFPAHVLLSAFDFGGRRVLQATVRDITPQKAAESALREKTEELDRFFNLALDLLCIADTDGYFRHLNRVWETTLGYTHEELEGRQFLELVHPDDLQSTLDAIAALSDQVPVIGFTNRYRCKDGSYRWIEWRSAPAGKLIYAAARDITPHIKAAEQLRQMNDTLDRRVHERTQQFEDSEAQLRRLNAELEQRVQERTTSLETANRELEAANQELGAFSYSVSHDLRAPLRHISGFVDLLLRDVAPQLDEKGRRWMGLVADAAKDMGQLIDDLLVFSRMGRTEMLHSDCDLQSIVREIMDALQNQTSQRRVDWIIPELPTVRGDPSMLRLALMNLASNALKYTRTRDPARIEITCTESGDEWIIATRDNGVGFDMQYADKLFGVFQRLHSSKEYEGTGIGLANVQRIIHRHGGRVWAESAVDKGATFYFSLPR
ncbi:MAG: PAS domain S-box protein [Bacteroidetes bacterium]|nr:PAS domain S-box protein [Bacteroidota bacterium]